MARWRQCILTALACPRRYWQSYRGLQSHLITLVLTALLPLVLFSVFMVDAPERLTAFQRARRDGYTVEVAANGRQALAKLQEHAYDLVMSDWRMPELDGPGLYQALEQHYPHLCQRFIFLTGDTLSPEILAFFAESSVPRLSKPFTVVEVRYAIAQVLGVV